MALSAKRVFYADSPFLSVEALNQCEDFR